MNTKIILDSTCDFPEGLEYLEKEFDILPSILFVDGEEFLDGVDIQLEEVFAALRAKKVVKTAQVSLYHFKELFSKYVEEKQDFIYLSFTSKHSGIFQTANMVVEDLREDHPDVKMAVIDTMGATVLNGELARILKENDEQGASFEDLVEFANNFVKYGEYNFVLKELDHLARGGRLSKIVTIAGGVLDIKPLLKLDKGELLIYKKIRTYKKAVKELVKMCLEGIGEYKDKPVYIGYSAERDSAEVLKKVFEDEGCTNVVLFQIGCGLASHLGMNGAGVLFMNQKYYEQ